MDIKIILRSSVREREIVIKSSASARIVEEPSAAQGPLREKISQNSTIISTGQV